MTARTTKKPAKAASKRTEPNDKSQPNKDAQPANGSIPEQPEANGSATALVTTDKANGYRRPPVPYSEEIGDIICDRLRDGETLNSICKSEGMPSESAVRLWASDDTPFAAKYARARELGYQKMADDLVDIADEAGDPNRNRLRVDTRKWLLSKALPKIYGDKLEVDAKAGLLLVETPAAIKALLEALPDLGVLPLDGSATAALASSGDAGGSPSDGGQP
jgi:hypothetical protein